MDFLDFLKIAPSSLRSYSSTSGRIRVSPKVSESLSHVLSRDMRFYGVPAIFSTRLESMNLITEPKFMRTAPLKGRESSVSGRKTVKIVEITSTNGRESEEINHSIFFPSSSTGFLGKTRPNLGDRKKPVQKNPSKSFGELEGG